MPRGIERSRHDRNARHIKMALMKTVRVLILIALGSAFAAQARVPDGLSAGLWDPLAAGWNRVQLAERGDFGTGKRGDFGKAKSGFVGGGPRIKNRQAASLVKKRYVNARILSISLIESKGPPVYRVKTLSDDGIVKYVFVDGQSGDVFE
jgi:hypothetical protein